MYSNQLNGNILYLNVAQAFLMAYEFIKKKPPTAEVELRKKKHIPASMIIESKLNSVVPFFGQCIQRLASHNRAELPS